MPTDSQLNVRNAGLQFPAADSSTPISWLSASCDLKTALPTDPRVMTALLHLVPYHEPPSREGLRGWGTKPKSKISPEQSDFFPLAPWACLCLGSSLPNWFALEVVDYVRCRAAYCGSSPACVDQCQRKEPLQEQPEGELVISGRDHAFPPSHLHLVGLSSAQMTTGNVLASWYVLILCLLFSYSTVELPY